MSPPTLDLVIESPVPLPPEPSGSATFAGVLFAPEPDAVARRPIFVGEIDGHDCTVDLLGLRGAALRARAWLGRSAPGSGATVALVRLPESAELPLAVAFAALLANGVRVLLPTGCELPELRRLFGLAGVTRVLTAPCREPAEPQRRARAALADLCRELALPLDEWGRTVDLLAGDPPAEDGLASRPPTASAVLFTTSGSTGQAKVVEYGEPALLRCAESWRAAGFFDDRLLGGASVVPLLSHTMGARDVLHALVARRPTLFVRPEWLESQPRRVVGMLVRHPPAHVTCGPALLHAIGGYMAAFPVLRERVEPGLRCVVSSGATFDPAVRRLFPSARLANAFGTTETQQVLCTLLSDAEGLGAPLPGCRVGLAWQDRTRGLGRLYVSAPFAARGYLGEPFGEWIDTGDLVRWDGRALHHAGRAAEDFLSSGLGLKVARATVAADYGRLLPELGPLLPLALPTRDGLVALAWTGGHAVDRDLVERVREAAAARTEQLAARGHDTSFNHLPLQAVGLVEGAPPQRGPGKLDEARASSENADLIDALGDPLSTHPAVVQVPPPEPASPRRRFQLPRLARLLETAGLDVDYVSGAGDVLEHARGRVLDLAGGYGTNLLGHGRRELLDAAHTALEGVPLLDQFSGRPHAARLAEALATRVGRETGRRYVVAFGSTGSEAVELALRHAALWRAERLASFERQLRQQFGQSHPALVTRCLAHNQALLRDRRPVLVALRGAFHGRTLGAMHLLSHEEQRRPCAGLLGAETVFVDPHAGPAALEHLREVARRERLLLRGLCRDSAGVREQEVAFSNVLATVAEPIQGEGGIHEIPGELLAALKLEGVPFILDEIQSGLGRAGSFLASADPDGPPVVADCYVLGKALGGGIAKLSALVVDRTHYVDRFDEVRESTFSSDAFSARVALEVLRIVDEDDVPGRARRAGEKMLAALRGLQARYPTVVRQVRGRGCMLGVELRLPPDVRSAILGALATRGLAHLAASYLLQVHRIRVLPATSAPDVLRIEPSADVTDEGIAWMTRGLEGFCSALASANTFELVCHLAAPGDETQRRQAAATFADSPHADAFRVVREAPAPGARRVAFLHHNLSPAKEMVGDSPSLMLLSTEERLDLTDRFQTIFELQPMASFSRNLFGGRVWLLGITLPVLPVHLHHLHRAGQVDLVLRRLEEAVQMAREHGCEVMAFGGYTSALSRDATLVPPTEGIRYSSGNAFTVAVTLTQLERACDEAGMPREGLKTAVVGALGNIGAAVSSRLAQRPGGELLLVGRPGSERRLAGLEEALQAVQAPGAARLRHTTDLAALVESDAVVLAVNNPDPLLWPEHLATDRPVVVADVSQPRAAAPGLARARPHARVFGTGMVLLPRDRDFLLSPHNPRGSLFACAAEGVLLGLSGFDTPLTGPVDPEAVEHLRRLGVEHGLFDELLFVP